MKAFLPPLPAAQDCKGCPIRHRAVCAMSDTAELAVLESIKSYRTYRPGEELVATEQPMNFVGSVVSGHIALRRTLPDGRRQVVGLLFPSDFLGRPGRAHAQHDAEALGEVTLCRFERRRFEELLATSPSLEKRLLQMTLDEIDAAREWLLLLGRKTAEEKVASFLAMVGRRSGTLERTRPAAGQPFDLPLSREDMAEYLGLTIETVSRQIGRLKRSGVIRLESARRVAVVDYALLMALTGDDADGGMI